ncbi:hypothetical protein DPMN_022925 [Dreissena polymorpha]|uniref:Uncharacterized protein n=1 Tax=Dreissena polymorpha TaxID=45954 RepID=A0A9D4LJS5_DREPO|nr:hypothetical protein DPMN_022925 [Dreissena polymorpha]
MASMAGGQQAGLGFDAGMGGGIGGLHSLGVGQNGGGVGGLDFGAPLGVGAGGHGGSAGLNSNAGQGGHGLNDLGLSRNGGHGANDIGLNSNSAMDSQGFNNRQNSGGRGANNNVDLASILASLVAIVSLGGQNWQNSAHGGLTGHL